MSFNINDSTGLWSHLKGALGFDPRIFTPQKEQVATPYIPSPIAPGQESKYLKERMHRMFQEQEAAKAQRENADRPRDSSAAMCPKGDRYLATQMEVFFGCPEGYTRPLFSDYCECQQGTQTQEPSLGNLFGLANTDRNTKTYLILGALAFFLVGRR